MHTASDTALVDAQCESSLPSSRWWYQHDTLTSQSLKGYVASSPSHEEQRGARFWTTLFSSMSPAVCSPVSTLLRSTDWLECLMDQYCHNSFSEPLYGTVRMEGDIWDIRAFTVWCTMHCKRALSQNKCHSLQFLHQVLEHWSKYSNTQMWFFHKDSFQTVIQSFTFSVYRYLVMLLIHPPQVLTQMSFRLQIVLCFFDREKTIPNFKDFDSANYWNITAYLDLHTVPGKINNKPLIGAKSGHEPGYSEGKNKLKHNYAKWCNLRVIFANISPFTFCLKYKHLLPLTK